MLLQNYALAYSTAPERSNMTLSGLKAHPKHISLFPAKYLLARGVCANLKY